MEILVEFLRWYKEEFRILPTNYIICDTKTMDGIPFQYCLTSAALPRKSSWMETVVRLPTFRCQKCTNKWILSCVLLPVVLKVRKVNEGELNFAARINSGKGFYYSCSTPLMVHSFYTRGTITHNIHLLVRFRVSTSKHRHRNIFRKDCRGRVTLLRYPYFPSLTRQKYFSSINLITHLWFITTFVSHAGVNTVLFSNLYRKMKMIAIFYLSIFALVIFRVMKA